MVFDVIVHVPVDELKDRVEMDRSRVQPMVEDVLRKASMLREVEHEMQPSSIKGREANEHQRKNAPDRNRPGNDRGIDRAPYTSNKEDIPLLGRRDVIPLLGRQSSDAMHKHASEFSEPETQIEDVQEYG